MKTPKEAFDFYDSDHKGYLTSHELKCCILYLTGVKISHITSKVLRDRSSQFSLQDVIRVMENQIKEDPGTEIFNALDFNQKGYLTFEDFSILCDVHAKHMKNDVREAVFKEIDSNDDGIVTLRDVQKIFKFSDIHRD
jgi:Ca2+-binding EF-hand superfamily protein